MICSCLVHHFIMTNSWLSNLDLFMTYSWLAQDLFPTSGWLVHDLFMTCSLFFMTCPYHIHNLFITLFSKYHNCYLSITPLCSRALPSQTWSLKIFWTQKVLYYEKCLDQQLFHKPNTQPPLGLMLSWHQGVIFFMTSWGYAFFTKNFLSKNDVL